MIVDGGILWVMSLFVKYKIYVIVFEIMVCININIVYVLCIIYKYFREKIIWL